MVSSVNQPAKLKPDFVGGVGADAGDVLVDDTAEPPFELNVTVQGVHLAYIVISAVIV